MGWVTNHHDSTIKDHLNTVRKHQEHGEGMQARYLSWQIQNEFINLCAKKVLDEILSEIEKSYYYGLIVDATPDVSHTEQLTFVIRFTVQAASGNSWKDFYKSTIVRRKKVKIFAGLSQAFLRNIILT